MLCYFPKHVYDGESAEGNNKNTDIKAEQRAGISSYKFFRFFSVHNSHKESLFFVSASQVRVKNVTVARYSGTQSWNPLITPIAEFENIEAIGYSRTTGNKRGL